MKNKICILILLLISLNAFCQKKILLLNKKNEPIQFANVKYGLKTGVYSNETGYFQITANENDTIKISSVGYKQYIILNKYIKDTVILEDDIIELKEIIISNKINKIKKVSKIKTKNSSEFYDGFRTSNGNEIATLIENNFPNNTVKLKKIIVPILTKTMNYRLLNKSQVLKKFPFQTYFRINFYENKNNCPGEKINEDNIIVKIDENSASDFQIDLKSNNIYIPENGFFVSIENLGEKNNSNDLFLTDSNYKNKADTFLMPQFILTNKLEKKITFFKNNFNEKNQWKNISDNDIKLSVNSKKESNVNLGIGYELEIYE